MIRAQEACSVFFGFCIEVAIKRYSFAFTNLWHGSQLYFIACKQERAQPFRIVHHNFFFHVVVEATVAVRSAAKATYTYGTIERHTAVVIRFYKLFDDAIISFLRYRQVACRQVA